jgi:hypothetical protein
MIELKKKHLKYRDGISYWELLFKHAGGEQVASLSKVKGLAWAVAPASEAVMPLLDDWKWQNLELVNDLKNELP